VGNRIPVITKAAELSNLPGAGANFQGAEPEPCWSPSIETMTPEPVSKFFTAKIGAGAFLGLQSSGAFVHAHVIDK